MKLKWAMTLLIGLSLLTLAAGLVVHAQGPGDETKKQAAVVESEAGVLGGIGNPPPAGFTVLYMFTGVANEAGGGDDEVTVVHCTNFHPTANVDIRVQVFPMNATATYEATLTVASGHTRTFATRSNAAFSQDVLLAPPVPHVFIGSGRVLVKQHREVICTAQVLDGDVDPPVYAVELEMFRR